MVIKFKQNIFFLLLIITFSGCKSEKKESFKAKF